VHVYPKNRLDTRTTGSKGRSPWVSAHKTTGTSAADLEILAAGHYLLVRDRADGRGGLNMESAIAHCFRISRRMIVSTPVTPLFEIEAPLPRIVGGAD
jgi:hypothetical protein